MGTTERSPTKNHGARGAGAGARGGLAPVLRRVRSWKQPSIHCKRAAITVLASTCIDMHTLSRFLNLGTFPATVAPGVCMLGRRPVLLGECVC
jgi:hypothetical protein